MPILKCTCECGCNKKFNVNEIDPDELYLMSIESLEQIKQCPDCNENIHYEHDDNGNSLEILKKRLARGEISIEEYDEIRSRI